MTSQQSEAIDLAEKGMASPINPTNEGLEADRGDLKVVLDTAQPSRMKSDTPSPEGGSTNISPGTSPEIAPGISKDAIVNRSENPGPKKSQAV